MITEAEIQSIDYASNSCVVRIPFFETLNTTQDVVLPSRFAIQPGIYSGYKVGDVVWVAFEDGQAKNPIIIGKVFKGTTDESDCGGAISCSSLSVSKVASIPDGTIIQTSDTNFNSIKKIIENVKNMQLINGIEGIPGGSLSSPLIIQGGDSSKSSKIVLSNSNKGQITDDTTATLFGFINNSELTVGSPTYSTNIRSDSRPSVSTNSENSPIALTADLDSYIPKNISSGDGYLIRTNNIWNITDGTNVSTTINGLSGGQLTSSVEIFSNGNSWNEGIRLHPAENNWVGIILCDSTNTGSDGTSLNTWSIHNHEGVFGIYKNGSSTSAPSYISYENDTWQIKGDEARPKYNDIDLVLMSDINYSITEKAIGNWIDDKTLYCKTFIFEQQITADQEIEIGDIGADIDTVVKINKVMRNSTQPYWFVDNYNTKFYIKVATNGKVFIKSNSENWDAPKLIVSIEYTKK